MIALYDLSNKPASFDFVQYLVIVTTKGYDHIRFYTEQGFRKKSKYNNAAERFENILKPACAFAGVGYSIGPREGDEFYHGVGGVISAYKEAGFLKKLKGVLPPVHNKVTITIRRCKREQRNSNLDAWDKFAKKVDAHVIPDYADKKIELHDRMALYEGAEMNFFVGNGPATLCIFSDANYAVVKMAPEKEGAGSPKFLKTQGLNEGSQFQWSHEKQRLFWVDDSYENICKAYEEMCSKSS